MRVSTLTKSKLKALMLPRESLDDALYRILSELEKYYVNEGETIE